jgi:hypothetical protein
MSKSLLRRGARSLSTAVPNASVQITTLPNKLRVATENTPGHFAAVGLYVDAGSRYETPSSSGVSHFLDRMAFKVSVMPSHMFLVTYLCSLPVLAQTLKCRRLLTPLVAKSWLRRHASR